MINLDNLRYLTRIGKIGDSIARVDFAGVNVNKLLEYEVRLSIASSEFVRSRLIHLAVSDFLEKNKIAGIIFRFENQPIDRALILAAKGKTNAFAYWHSTLSLCDNYLSLQNMIGVSRTFNNGNYNEILPDKFLSANSFCTATLEHHGIPKSKIVEIGPTRQWKILEQLEIVKATEHEASKAFESSKNESLKVIICFSADKKTSLTMLNSVMSFFEGVSGMAFYVKSHPAWLLEHSEVEAISSKFGRNMTMINNSDAFFNYLSKSSVVITGGTQLAFESILFNTMPIVYESQYQFIPTNYDRFDNVCFLVHSFASLNNALDAINERNIQYEEKVRNWPYFLEEFIGEVDCYTSTEKFNVSIANLIERDT
jgi:hypothetical protein